MTSFHDGLHVAPNTDPPYPRYPGPPPDGLEVVPKANAPYPGYVIGYGGKNHKEDFQMYSQPISGDRICGLRRVTFWLVIVIVVLVVAGAVGGGVGGSLAEKKANSDSSPSEATVSAASSSLMSVPSSTMASSTISSSSSTSSASTSPSSTDIAGCPSSDHTIYIPENGPAFERICHTDFWTPSNSYPIDLTHMNATSLDSCVDACVAWNVNQNAVPGRGGCMAVSLDMSTNGNTGDCWLKNSTGNQVVVIDYADTAVACVESLC